MHNILVKTEVLSSFSLAMLARVRHLYPKLALDAIDPTRVDYVDGEGNEWTDLAGGSHKFDVEHVARLGWLAANREAMKTYVENLPEEARYPAKWPTATLDIPALRAGIDAVLAPQVVRNEGEEGVAFEERTDLETVFVEQGEQDVMLLVSEIPEGFERPAAEEVEEEGGE